MIKDNLIVNCPKVSIRFDARAAGWAKNHVKNLSPSGYFLSQSEPFSINRRRGITGMKLPRTAIR